MVVGTARVDLRHKHIYDESKSAALSRSEVRTMSKASELREMSDEQLEMTALEAAETMFRLRLQSQTDRVDVPSQKQKNRRLIARVRTIQTERAKGKKN